jgi:alpha-L-fucosidase
MSNSIPEQIVKGPFEPTWESLRQYACPQWFRDAKFGIWAHWGPQCVPMCGDWYARRMYQPNDWLYHHHWRVYGHPSKFGYKNIIPLWKAERFDPEGLMALYAAAGAKYFVAQAVHHDNFDNWNSTHHRWNATKVGPMKDIVGLWHEASNRRGLRFGVSEHLGASFSWMKYNKNSDPDGPYAGVPYDGNDPAYEDLYLPNKGDKNDWYTDNPWWHACWFARMKDLVDQHRPDLFYSDGGVPFGEVGLSLIAHLYNTSAGMHGGVNEAVYTQKDSNPDVYRVGVLDIERGQRPEIAEHPWQTDTSVSDWYFDSRYAYKTPKHVIEMLVDIISKNGNLLLNQTQRPDGTLDDECLWILKALAGWIKANGEGVYGTRPWKTAGEGPATMQHGAFKEDAVHWTVEDFRFTCQGNTVYAFQMKYPEGGAAAVRSLGKRSGLKVAGVRLLGYGGPVAYEQAEQALVVRMPEQKGAIAPCLAVTLA